MAKGIADDNTRRIAPKSNLTHVLNGKLKHFLNCEGSPGIHKWSSFPLFSIIPTIKQISLQAIAVFSPYQLWKKERKKWWVEL